MGKKKLFELGIGDQVHVVLNDGEMKTYHVNMITKEELRAEIIYIGIEDDELTAGGYTSSNIRNHSMSASNCGYKLEDIYTVTSNYQHALRVAIARTRMVQKEINKRLEILTDNALKNANI